jgi:hypothetical protein
MSTGIVALADELLAVTGIERVVSIDDAYAEGAEMQEVLAAVDVAEATTLDEVGKLLDVETSDPDSLRFLLRERWGSLSVSAKQALAAQLLPPEEYSTEGKAVENDLQIATNLPNIFGTKLEMLSLKVWKSRRAELINESMPSTLLLVDLSFVDEAAGTDEGLKIITALLESEPQAKIYCALLTNRYPVATIPEKWLEVCQETGLPPDKFVLIPKDIVSTDERRFLALIKLVVMNGRANALKNAVIGSFGTSLQKAESDLSSINIFDFEQIVCVSSLREGVWESDTLVRLFSLFHKHLVRDSLHTDVKVHQLTDELRRLSLVDVGEWAVPTTKARSIQRMEWYESAASLNRQFLPTELGDFFAISGRTDKMYVLAAQPCDLMVRYESKGRRHHKVKNAVLLEAYRGDRRGDASFCYDLEYFEPSVEWHVDLRSVHYVCLDVIDLCAIREDGRAEMALDMEVPLYLCEPWRARVDILRKQTSKIISKYQELLKKGLSSQEANAIATNASLGKLFSGKVDVAKKTVTYNFARVGRLKQPRAGALLSRYANAMARDAFEHSFVRSANTNAVALEDPPPKNDL